LAASTAVSCYMCPQSQSYFLFDDEGTSENPWIKLWNAGESNGYTPTTAVSPETTYFNAWNPTPVEEFGEDQVHEIVKSIALQYLNTSIVEKDGISVIPGLIFETVWAWGENEITLNDDDLGIFKMVGMSKWSENLVYCRSQESNKYFTALVSPYDNYVWALLVITFLALCLLPGVCFGMALNIIWLSLGQPPQGKKIRAIILLVTLGLIPIQYIYKEFFATNAMTPFEKPKLRINREVFEEGFRLICNNDRECKYAPSELKFRNLRLPKDAGQYIIGYKELGAKPDAENILALARDRGVTSVDSRFKDHVLAEQENYAPGTKCYMVDEHWSVVLASFSFTGPLSQAMYTKPFATYDRLELSTTGAEFKHQLRPEGTDRRS